MRAQAARKAGPSTCARDDGRRGWAEESRGLSTQQGWRPAPRRAPKRSWLYGTGFGGRSKEGLTMWRTRSRVPRRDLSRRLSESLQSSGGIDTSVDTARKSARATPSGWDDVAQAVQLAESAVMPTFLRKSRDDSRLSRAGAPRHVGLQDFAAADLPRLGSTMICSRWGQSPMRSFMRESCVTKHMFGSAR